MKLMKQKLIKNIILFYFGMTTYMFIEQLYRNYTFLIMGICGGLAVVLLDKLNNYISWDMDILIQGCIGSALITLMEFIIGNLYIIGVLPKMWDYSNTFMNYKGIICLPFSLLWILLSIIAIIVADSINYYLFNELPVPYYKLFGKVILKFKEKT